MNQYQELFSPCKIGSCELKNRYVMEPMGPAGLADASGAFNDKAIEFYTERARGGVGLIIAGMCYVENEVEWHAAGTMPCPTISPALFKRTAIQLTERVHAYGAKIFIQLSAGFGRVSNRIKPGTKPIGPSEIPYRWDPSIICRAITTEEVEKIVKAMGQAASIAKAAGFDGVEIHAMHEGYLIDQFALECCNHRTDKYGGSRENRIRFAVEILESIKNACGKDFPVVMRYSSKSFMKDFGKGALPGEEFEEMGRDLDEGLVIAKMLEEAGYDALDADVGCYDSWYWNHPPMYFEEGMYLPFNKLLKEKVSIPVLTAGRMENPELALKAVREGATDLIGLARPLMADGLLVEKIRKDQMEDIRPCLSCQEGCIGRLKQYLHISCAVNPAACRERELELRPALKPRRIAVIGGGIGGCEAARVLKERGHEVTLYEESGRLGGKLLLAGAPDFKKDDLALVHWYERQMEKLNIPVRFHTVIREPEQIKDADAVILACGSKAVTFNLGEKVPVVDAGSVLEAPDTFKGPFVIVGGGLVGCETALMLAKKGQQVSIVEMLPGLMQQNGPICYANRQMLIDLLAFYKVKLYCGSRALRTEEGGLLIECGGQEQLAEASTVILAVGYRADRGLEEKLREGDQDVYVIGDAKSGGGNILHTIWDAYEVASHL